MKVLSRKPAEKATANVNGMGYLTREDDDEDEEGTKNIMTPEQRMQKAQREREEKQKAYEERRRELFGKDNSAIVSPSGKSSGSPRNQSRAKGSSESRPSSAVSNMNRQLFDPNESAKPENLRMPKKELQPSEAQPIREPRAPDSSGRGGFGFAPRGGKAI